MSEFIIKDSGERKVFASGMTRDTGDKPRFLRILDGPMAERWAIQLHKGAKKYPDVRPGVPNWTLADGEEEMRHAMESAMDHMVKWLRGDLDEDHAAAIFFNVNEVEFIKDKLKNRVKKENTEEVHRLMPLDPIKGCGDTNCVLC